VYDRGIQDCGHAVDGRLVFPLVARFDATDASPPEHVRWQSELVAAESQALIMSPFEPCIELNLVEQMHRGGGADLDKMTQRRTQRQGQL
jgi:hypothetical protein